MSEDLRAAQALATAIFRRTKIDVQRLDCHLLLGTNHHATSGLMRAVWSGADLRRNVPTDWHFLGSEADAMRAGLEARAYRTEL